MTLFANAGAKDPLWVRILVACHAALYINGPKFAFSEVALVAGEFLVTAGEWKYGLFRVVKLQPPFKALPIRGRMAAFTIIQIAFARFAVVAPMTALTGIRRIEVAVPVRLWPFCTVTLTTFDITVAPGQGPARQAVVKGPLVQLCDVMVRSNVFAVTLIAGFFACHARMIPAPITEALLDLLVAVEAFLIRGALKWRVTLTA